MNFWLSAALLTAAVALVCFYPLLRNSRTTKVAERDEINKAFYFDRLQEIERDEQQGLLDNAHQLKVELQQALLQDIPERVEEIRYAEQRYGKIWFVSGLLSLGIIATTVYFSVGSWQAEAMIEKTHQKLPHFYERLKEEESNPLSETEMQQFATALRIELQKNPNDAKSWWLLGQIGTAMDNGQLAYDSYGKAVQLEPENIDYKIGYARILSTSEDQSDRHKGEELLKEVIRKDHTNIEALSLLAFRYFEQEDYKMAAVTWAMMLRLMPEDDTRRELIEKSIRSARDALAEQEEEKNKQTISK